MTIKSIRWAQGNDSSKVAKELAGFISAAKKSLDIAIYDFRLSGDNKTTVVNALKEVAKAHKVRIAYDHTKQSDSPDTGKGGIGNDPAPRGTQQFVQQEFPESTRVLTQAIAGSHLMHSKYVIRDGHDIWMGSANFTDDAWKNQENNILEISSTELAKHYEADFNQLWTTKNIKAPATTITAR